MRNLHKNTRSNTRAAKRKSNRSASHNSPEASILDPPTPQATENTHINKGDAGGAVQIPKPHESPEISETTEEINDIFIKVYDHTHTMYTD